MQYRIRDIKFKAFRKNEINAIYNKINKQLKAALEQMLKDNEKITKTDGSFTKKVAEVFNKITEQEFSISDYVTAEKTFTACQNDRIMIYVSPYYNTIYLNVKAFWLEDKGSFHGAIYEDDKIYIADLQYDKQYLEKVADLEHKQPYLTNEIVEQYKKAYRINEQLEAEKDLLPYFAKEGLR